MASKAIIFPRGRAYTLAPAASNRAQAGGRVSMRRGTGQEVEFDFQDVGFLPATAARKFLTRRLSSPDLLSQRGQYTAVQILYTLLSVNITVLIFFSNFVFDSNFIRLPFCTE